jgi:GABA(A) receptor-associated protein
MEYIMKSAEHIMNLAGGTGGHIKSRTEADRIMNKYPDRIPVLVTRNKYSTNTPDIDKHKYLVPSDLSMGQLMFVIRRRLNLKPEKGLFLFVDGSVVCNSEMVSVVYYRSHDPEDGFLHAVYSCENVFGSNLSTFGKGGAKSPSRATESVATESVATGSETITNFEL